MPRAIFLAFLFIGFLAAVLFGSAGRIDWPMAWAVLGVFLAFTVLAFLVVDPALIRERSHAPTGTNGRDVALASAGFVWLFPLTLGVAGLDAGRFGWSPPLPRALELAALAVFVLAYAFALWAMRCNRFFSTFVRIQVERGHHVVDRGPYACVRHPGYAGQILASLAVPVALGSLWSLIPACVGVGLFIARTGHEDRTLVRELGGYAEYAARVRWRLLPGIW